MGKDYFFDDLDEFYSHEDDVDGNKKEDLQDNTQQQDGNKDIPTYDEANYEYYDHYYDPNSVMEKFLKCECGSDSANLMRHSEWCPKFEEWMRK